MASWPEWPEWADWAAEGIARQTAVAGGVAALLSLAGTGLVLVVARRQGLLAQANERSSHEQPTPSGGGVAIVAAVCLVVGPVAWGWRSLDLGLVLFGALVVCALGLIDDVREVAALPKMLTLLAVAVLLLPLGVVGGVELPFLGEVSLGLLAIPLTLFWTSCFPNAFNFMDGINGIAALTASLVAGALAVWSVDAGRDLEAVLAAATCGAALGFLPWNFPRARIFMGDAGSLPLGLLLAAAPLMAQAPFGVDESSAPNLRFPAAALLLAPFVFDVGFTLLRRARAGHSLTVGHREHLYQRLARALGGHAPATLIYGALSLLMLPAAWWWQRGGEWAQVLVLVAVASLMAALVQVVVHLERRRAGDRLHASADGS